MKKTIQQRIIGYLKPVSEGIVAADVRIELGYTSVRLDNGNIGIAWTAQTPSGSCTYEPKAGMLGGMKAGELLDMLSVLHKPLSRSIGLATANALAAGLPRQETSRIDVLDLIQVNPRIMWSWWVSSVPLYLFSGRQDAGSTSWN
ncbi:MAG TPA: DUF4213 domain-containing protein [Deltaproteobacteria bacterium]|jgi:hypothetical protein|nr:DUF4213 domain-containing protein [Deltaproteobacteria bacterium]